MITIFYLLYFILVFYSYITSGKIFKENIDNKNNKWYFNVNEDIRGKNYDYRQVYPKYTEQKINIYTYSHKHMLLIENYF